MPVPGTQAEDNRHAAFHLSLNKKIVEDEKTAPDHSGAVAVPTYLNQYPKKLRWYFFYLLFIEHGSYMG